MATVATEPRAEDYRVLGLEPGATDGEVKTAYRALAKKWHPDHHRHRSSQDQRHAEQRFREVTTAYQRLAAALQAQHLLRTVGREETSKEQSAGAKDPGQPKPGVMQPEERGQQGHRSTVPLQRWLDALLPGRSRFYAGLVCGLALMISALLLLAQTEQVPPRTVIPRLEEGKFLLTVPKDETAGTRTRPVPRPSPTAIAPGNSRPSYQPSVSGKAFFGLGADPEAVLKVQGPPTRTVGNLWSYGLSEVRFRQGRVQGYNNFDGKLRVRLIPRTDCGPDSPTFFTLGSSKDQVICAQGTPSRVDGNRWYYGFDVIRFKHDRVAGYSNSYGNLKVRLMIQGRSEPSGTGFFSIGSKPGEVLAVQGTPLEIHNNIWYYGFSDVQFSNGRVKWVNDPAGHLKFLETREKFRL